MRIWKEEKGIMIRECDHCEKEIEEGRYCSLQCEEEDTKAWAEFYRREKIGEEELRKEGAVFMSLSFEEELP